MTSVEQKGNHNKTIFCQKITKLFQLLNFMENKSYKYAGKFFRNDGTNFTNFQFYSRIFFKKGISFQI